jgi:hypothetical protein
MHQTENICIYIYIYIYIVDVIHKFLSYIYLPSLVSQVGIVRGKNVLELKFSISLIHLIFEFTKI